MKTRNRTREGFTLVELLVVISIIGMLMALLLPAVQSARESARANTCRNNLRNFGLAMAQYESARNTYPGFVNDIGTGNNSARSWTFVLLPYLENRATYDQYFNKDMNPASANYNTVVAGGTANAMITTSLEFAICPSNPPESITQANTCYVANSGQVDISPTPPGSRDYRGNGVFHYRGVPAVSGSIPETLVNVSNAFISGADGTPNTLLLGENADAHLWTDVSERFTGFGYHWDVGTAGTASNTNGYPMQINIEYAQSKVGLATPSSDTRFMRPSAYHPSGANFVFCDSHVRFLSETISYGVFQALCTTRGAQSYNNNTATIFPSTGGSPHPATQVVDASSLQ